MAFIELDCALIRLNEWINCRAEGRSSNEWLHCLLRPAGSRLSVWSVRRVLDAQMGGPGPTSCQALLFKLV